MSENLVLPSFTKGSLTKESLRFDGDSQKEYILNEGELLKAISKAKKDFAGPFVELKAEVILKGYEKDEEGYCWPIYKVKK
ncbi:hypothetical protein [Alkaliphilus sp. B6464]|uniref:hypothetical protein n=1 Tax=Alkaliphilus sp. B6464 TaxID=2731219 RepID=UPI001BADB603|nr:hypothetical protein [Alkaliphilus sp. B6464]QUH21079.1 hypothetical protein HYG84_15125 [Alkaliphilus sp. B6464]